MRFISCFIAIFLSFLSFSQSDKAADYYHKIQKSTNSYQKDKSFKGPADWNTPFPGALSEPLEPEQRIDDHSAIKDVLSEERISDDRVSRFGEEYGHGVAKRPNPKILPPNPIEFPEFKLPEIDFPDVDLPNVKMPSIGSWELWRIILLLIVICAVLFGIYLIIKNQSSSDKKVKLNSEDDWDPTIIPKTELFQRLENATFSDDYRECIRIYFMLILKELVNKGIIDWQPIKTNYNYLNEVRKARGYDEFQECVRIYDLVWYGDYSISKDDYTLLKPPLENYYQSLISQR